MTIDDHDRRYTALVHMRDEAQLGIDESSEQTYMCFVRSQEFLADYHDRIALRISALERRYTRMTKAMFALSRNAEKEELLESIQSIDLSEERHFAFVRAYDDILERPPHDIHERLLRQTMMAVQSVSTRLRQLAHDRLRNEYEGERGH